jgi:predicted small metal-binding protein
MDSVLHCDCGFEARAADEEGLVAEVQRHAREAHSMTLTRDEALLLVFRAELDERAPLTIPRETTTRTKKEEEA